MSTSPPNKFSYKEVTSQEWVDTRTSRVFEKHDEYVVNLNNRLLRATGVLEAAGIPYAVIGGNAVAAWVASVEPAAVRSTKDIDILLRRSDLDLAIKALEAADFHYHHVAGLDFFTDGPEGKACDGVHIVFADEKVRPEYTAPAPQISEAIKFKYGYYVTTLEAIVRMKLTSHRLRDQVHLQDMLSVGLIDASWLETLPSDLADRLRHLIENPEE